MKPNSNLPLLLLAFTIAVVIKLTVSEGEQLGTRSIAAQITYGEISDDIVVYDRRVETVQVGVRGPASDLARLTGASVLAAVPQGRTGSVDIPLSPEDVTPLPGGDFEVISIEPDTVTVQIEPRARKTVEVRIELVDEPAAGARPGEKLVLPKIVEITGPRSRVDRVEFITGQVSLEGHGITFEDEVALDAPQFVQVVPRRVMVQVTMEEPELSISVENIQNEGTVGGSPGPS